MRHIPFYGDDDPSPLAWQRAAVSATSAAERRNESLLSAALSHARRSYTSGRWALSNPAHCVDYLRAQLRTALARNRQAVIEIDGVKLKLRPHYSLHFTHALLARAYAAPERLLLRTHLEERDAVMEVGCGIGLLSAYCARRIGSHRVVAYESHPLMARAARDTFALNGVAPRLEHCALGCPPGARAMYAGTPVGDARSRRRHHVVPARTLSDAVRQHRPTFLIVNAEAGGRELLREVIDVGVPKLLVSFRPEHLGANFVARAQRAFAQAGYVSVEESPCGKHVLYRRYQSGPTLIDDTPRA